MTKRYLHIAFGLLDSERLKKLETLFAQMSDDWLRYSGTCWIAWTQHDSASWFKILEPYLKKNECMLILELKQGQGALHGMMPQWVWGWLNTIRS